MRLGYLCKSVSAMFLAPVRNCHEFFISRKPLLIFFICLLIMVTTTLYLSFYVTHTEKIIDDDTKENWMSLVRHLNKLDLCFTDSADNTTQENNYDEFNFTTTVNINSSQFYDLAKIRAVYSLKGWHTPNPQSSNRFTVDFLVPPNSNETDNITSVCAVIRGPKQFLPGNSLESCVATNEIEDNPTLIFESCPSGDARVLFDGDLEVYLTQDDKNNINVHLMWSSYMLLFFIFIMLIYAMFHRAENSLADYRRA